MYPPSVSMSCMAAVLAASASTSAEGVESGDCWWHRLRTPNEGIDQRNMKIWADVTDKICMLWPYTANVYMELQGLYSEIGVQGFQIYGDCMYTRNPCNFEIPHSYFHCSICRKYDFTGILRGFPALDVGKPCNNLIFLKYPCKICRDNL